MCIRDSSTDALVQGEALRRMADACHGDIRQRQQGHKAAAYIHEGPEGCQMRHLSPNHHAGHPVA